MLHLPPLPGSPRDAGDLAKVRQQVLDDARALADGGVHGLMMENFGDTPFHPGRVGPETVSHMTALAQLVRQATGLPLGINVLRNDAEAALAVAQAVGGSFIRVNVLQSAAVTDQGLIAGRAAEVLRYRRAIGAGDVRIFADVRVKHAAPLVARPLAEEVADLVHRGHADAVIVTGGATGRAADTGEFEAVCLAADGAAEVWVGSGVTAETVEHFAAANGFLVGTHFKRAGRVDQPVDERRVRAFVSRLESLA